jgi:predicted GNAT family acetyltransferase
MPPNASDTLRVDVDEDPLRGKGGGLRLFNGMVDWARNTGTKIMSTCPFANSMFDRHPASRDVLT